MLLLATTTSWAVLWYALDETMKEKRPTCRLQIYIKTDRSCDKALFFFGLSQIAATSDSFRL